MSDFNLARESCQEMLDYNVIVSESENASKEYRLKNTGAVGGFKIRSPQLTKTQMQAYRDFIKAKYGAYTSFTFTSPFDDVEYTVRFVPGSFATTFESGTFQCSFEFEIC
jgi:hypothetical protein